MQGGYRKADMIELHDPGIVVHVDDFPANGLDWRTSRSVAGTRIAVDGNEAARLFEALGITFDADVLFGDIFDVLFRRPATIGMVRLDDPPENVPLGDGSLEGVVRIQELRARPEEPNLLHIHISSTVGASDDDDLYVQELTYSGSYTVWWSTAAE